MLEKAELRFRWRRRLLLLLMLHMLLLATQSDAKTSSKKGGKSSKKEAKPSPAQRLFAANTIRQGLASVDDGTCPLIRKDPKELDVGMDKPLGVHFSCCAEGNIGDLLKGLTCVTTSIYVNLHCGGECKLCNTQRPGILEKGSKQWNAIITKLKVPKPLKSCTQLEIDPPGGMRWVMLFNFLQHDYDNLPGTMVFLKDSYRNTVYKAERRNKGSFIKKKYPKLVKGLPVPIPKVLQGIAKGTTKIGFQHITQRVNWGTGGFLRGHENLGQAMGDFYKFFSCTEIPENGWPAVPGGLVAVERARVRRLPQRAYGEIRSILLKLRDRESAGIGAVSMEHNIATAFGCAGPDRFPKCPPLASNWTSEVTLADKSLFKDVPALPPASHSAHAHPMPLDATNTDEQVPIPANDDGDDDEEDEEKKDAGDEEDDDEEDEVGDGGGHSKGDNKEFKDDGVDAEEEVANDEDGGGANDDDREFMDADERESRQHSKATRREPSASDVVATAAPLSPWLGVLLILVVAYGAFSCSQRNVEVAEQTRAAKTKQPVGQ